MAISRVRHRGAFAPLSAHYYKDDAIDEAGPDAELLYVRGLAFCAEVLSDGYISDRQLMRFVGSGLDDVMGRAKTLAAVGLWERADGGYIVRSWLEWNRSRAEITRYQEKDAARKRGQAGSEDDSEPEPPPPNRPRGTPKPPPAESKTSSSRTPRGIQAESANGSERTAVGIHTPHPHPHPHPHPEPEQTLPLAVLAAHDQIDRFPEFWSAYPRKVDKRDAERAWKAALKRGVDQDHLVQAAVRFGEWTRTNKKPMKWIKHPSVWLNKGAYDNELEQDSTSYVAPADQNIINIQALKARFPDPKPENVWRQLPGGSAS